mgnify:CR=1 FL=1
MSTHQYLLVPTLKLVWDLGNIHIEEEEWERVLNSFSTFERASEDALDVMEKKYKDLTMTDLKTLLLIADNLWPLGDEWLREPYLVLYIFKKYGYDVELKWETEVNLSKLLKKGWKYVSFWSSDKGKREE